MVKEAQSRLYKRKDEKYMIYLDYSLATDSMFPYPLEKDSDMHVRIFFNDKGQLIIEKWNEEAKQ